MLHNLRCMEAECLGSFKFWEKLIIILVCVSIHISDRSACLVPVCPQLPSPTFAFPSKRSKDNKGIRELSAWKARASVRAPSSRPQRQETASYCGGEGKKLPQAKQIHRTVQINTLGENAVCCVHQRSGTS